MGTVGVVRMITRVSHMAAVADQRYLPEVGWLVGNMTVAKLRVGTLRKMVQRRPWIAVVRTLGTVSGVMVAVQLRIEDIGRLCKVPLCRHR